jgi:phosphotriesterase-related protein
MPFVRTVTGDIDAKELGVTYAHEHILINGGMQVYLDKDFLLNDSVKAAADLSEFRAAGGRSVVDMIPCGLGRDPDGLRTVSGETGVQIIAATGFHTERYYDTNHWLYQYSVEQIAELFTAEIEDGMDQWGYRGPLVRRSGARAGVLKVATGYYSWNSNTDRWFEAAAIAHAATGVPISSHTENGVLGEKQVEALTSRGVPPSSIIVGHIDKNVDPYVHRELASMGVFLEYDSPARLKYGPDADAVSLIRSAAEGGYADHVLLGMDLARRSYYPSYGGGPGLTYLLTRFIPRLGAEGLGEVAEGIMIDNPARAFAFAQPAA